MPHATCNMPHATCHRDEHSTVSGCALVISALVQITILREYSTQTHFFYY